MLAGALERHLASLRCLHDRLRTCRENPRSFSGAWTVHRIARAAKLAASASGEPLFERDHVRAQRSLTDTVAGRAETKR